MILQNCDNWGLLNLYAAQSETQCLPVSPRGIYDCFTHVKLALNCVHTYLIVRRVLRYGIIPSCKIPIFCIHLSGEAIASALYIIAEQMVF